jgi:flagellar biogenesis protein FliO
MHPSQSNRKEQMGYGLVGILVIILLIVLIFYFVRRA